MDLVPSGRPKPGHVFVQGTIRKNQKDIGRNELCPCGSGKKYKKCCMNLGRRRVGRPRPRLLPGIQVTPAPQQTQEQNRLGQGNADTVKAMLRSGVRKEFVYAYMKTGKFITHMSRDAHAPEVLEEWDAAVQEYRDAHPEELEDADNQAGTDAPRAESDGGDAGLGAGSAGQPEDTGREDAGAESSPADGGSAGVCEGVRGDGDGGPA